MQMKCSWFQDVGSSTKRSTAVFRVKAHGELRAPAWPEEAGKLINNVQGCTEAYPIPLPLAAWRRHPDGKPEKKLSSDQQRYNNRGV